MTAVKHYLHHVSLPGRAFVQKQLCIFVIKLLPIVCGTNELSERLKRLWRDELGLKLYDFLLLRCHVVVAANAVLLQHKFVLQWLAMFWLQTPALN
jgi:hypothetical protein